MDSENEPLSHQQTPDFDNSSGIDALDDLHQTERNRSKRRIATVYDAVSGRLSHHRGTLTHGENSKPALVTKYSLRETKYGPDEVLFRRVDAPQRYAEHDLYYAHERDLPRGGRGVLPESDLLKAIHDYSGRFYGHMRRRGNVASQSCNVDEASMDETALLAFGILLEEAGRDILGKSGDMVFTEGIEPENKEEELPQRRNKQILSNTVGPLDGMVRQSQVKRRSKRRKIGSPRKTKS
ncbi:membrane protein [Cordyceps javanica]|uniref:Membrane protein n=1 Tax=Cordyceps javanica TaxID=43265 RepID=A0A545VG63_9HYPO|nr:membrane protein [Cordyceps javanica]TQW11899.1 membrane protein [Cordyceps javanica]